MKLILYNGQPTDAAIILKKVIPFNVLDSKTINTIIKRVEVRD